MSARRYTEAAPADPALHKQYCTGYGCRGTVWAKLNADPHAELLCPACVREEADERRQDAASLDLDARIHRAMERNGELPDGLERRNPYDKRDLRPTPTDNEKVFP